MMCDIITSDLISFQKNLYWAFLILTTRCSETRVYLYVSVFSIWILSVHTETLKPVLNTNQDFFHCVSTCCPLLCLQGLKMRISGDSFQYKQPSSLMCRQEKRRVYGNSDIISWTHMIGPLVDNHFYSTALAVGPDNQLLLCLCVSYQLLHTHMSSVVWM